MEVVVHHVAEEAGEVVEALAVGQALGAVSQVPLPDAGGVIAGALQDLGKQHRIRREVAPAVSRRVRADDAGHADQLGIATAQQGCPRRRADRAVGVGLRELHAARQEAVDPRRLQVFGAVAGQVACAQVVDQDDDDVGGEGLLRHGGSGRSGRCRAC